MSAEAGTVYAEIRVALDKFQNDIDKVNKLFTQAGAGIDKQNKETLAKTENMSKSVVDSLKNMSSTGVNQFAKMAQGINTAFQSLPIIGLITGVIATVQKLGGALINFLKEGEEAYTKHQQALTKMNTMIINAGASAWTSTKELAAQARELGNNSNFAQDALIDMQATLLQFKSITGDTFTNASKVIVNMATAIGTDLSSATAMVAKALETPEIGLRQLTKQGVFFTDTQKQMINNFIAMGDRAAAQQVILDELGARFTGVAEKVSTVTSEHARLDTATENLKRAQGEATQGITKWWYSIRAAIKEAKLEVIEFNAKLNKALKADYSDQIAQIGVLNDKLNGLTDTYEQLALQDQITKMELDLKIDIFEDNLVKARAALMELDNNFTMLDRDGNEYYQNESRRLREVEAREQERLATAKRRAAEHASAAAARAETNAKELDQLDQIRRLDKEKIAVAQERETKEKALLKELQLGLITQDEYKKGRVDLLKAEAEGYIRIQAELKAMENVTGEAASKQTIAQAQIERAIEGAAESYKAAHAEIDRGKKIVETNSNTYEEQFKKLKETHDKSLATVRSLKKEEVISVEEAAQQEYDIETNFAKAIEALWKSMGMTKENSEKHWGEATEAIDESTKAAEENKAVIDATNQSIKDRKAREEAVQAVDTQIYNNQKQIDLIEAKRKEDKKEILRIQWEMVEASIRESTEYKNLTAGLQEGSDEMTEARGKQIDMIQKAHELFNAQNDINEKTEKYKQILADVIKYGGAGAQAMGAIMGAVSAWVNKFAKEEIDALEKTKEADLKFMRERQNEEKKLMDERHEDEINLMKIRQDEEKRIFEERYNTFLEDINRRMEAELYAAGLIEAKTEEDANAELERAKATMDQKQILQAQNRLKRIQIEKDYADQSSNLEQQRYDESKLLQAQQETEQKATKDRQAAEDADRDAKAKAEQEARDIAFQKKKAKIEFDAAMVSWAFQLTQAITSVALAVAQTLANPILAGIAATAGAASIATIAANKPKLQTFSEGGIVKGSMFRGDNTPVLANAGELVATVDQQRLLADALAGKFEGNDKPIQVTNQIYLDNMLIAQAVAQVYNNGIITLRHDRAII